MDTGLKGRVVLITGASRNMGRAAAIAFAREGANLALCTSQKMKELGAVAEEARSLGVRAIAVQCDVTDGAAVAAFVKRAREELGRVDVAINVAGYRNEAKFLEGSPEAWTRNIEVNLNGPFNVCRSVIPLMIERRWGRIINLSGIAPYIGDGVAKSTVKLGIVGFTRGIAREFAGHNITANCIGPGNIDRQRDAHEPERKINPIQPIRRKGRAEEVTGLMPHLASESSSFITGQCYLVNGGAYFS